VKTIHIKAKIYVKKVHIMIDLYVKDDIM